MNGFIVLPADGVCTNFRSWNPMNNHYDSMKKLPKKQPPKKLIAAVIREFKRQCAFYHIDASAYRFVQPVAIEDEWKQCDFIDDPKAQHPATIIISDIVANKNGTLLQSVFSI